MSVFFGILSLEESFLINTKRGAQDISLYMHTWRPSKVTSGLSASPTTSLESLASPTPLSGLLALPTPLSGSSASPTPSSGLSASPTTSLGSSTSPTPSSGSSASPIPFSLVVSAFHL